MAGREPAPAGRHLCSWATEINLSSVRSGICRPDGAGKFCGVGGYKDFAPDGAFGRSATVSAGPAAAASHGWCAVIVRRHKTFPCAAAGALHTAAVQSTAFGAVYGCACLAVLARMASLTTQEQTVLRELTRLGTDPFTANSESFPSALHSAASRGSSLKSAPAPTLAEKTSRIETFSGTKSAVVPPTWEQSR